MTTVFVTGASGNVGRNVTRELLGRGHSVAALVRAPVGIEGCRPIFGSLADIGSVAHEISKADSIIHIACARSNKRETVINEDILGTARMIDAWARGNFVYTSSQTVYGIPEGDLTEDSPLNPVFWYDLGKICNEFQIKMAAGTDGRGTGVSLRMAVMFGPGSTGPGPPQFHEMIYEACLRGETFLFDSEEGLETWGTSFIGERDLARAIVDSLLLAESGAYNVAGFFCTWRELLETFDRHAGIRSRFTVRAGAVPRPGEFRLPQSRSFIDASKFNACTGFAPEQTLDELIENFVRAQKERDAG